MLSTTIHAVDNSIFKIINHYATFTSNKEELILVSLIIGKASSKKTEDLHITNTKQTTSLHYLQSLSFLELLLSWDFWDYKLIFLDTIWSNI